MQSCALLTDRPACPFGKHVEIERRFGNFFFGSERLPSVMKIEVTAVQNGMNS